MQIKNREKHESTAEREIIARLSKGTLYYKTYYHSTKSIMQARYFIFIEEADDLLFVDEEITKKVGKIIGGTPDIKISTNSTGAQRVKTK